MMNANSTLTQASDRRASRVRPLAFGVVAAVARGLMAAARWWRIRQDEHLLLSQPEHLLRDIGIDRRQIPTVLRTGLRR
jgi:uncharacterized protein YjiS (DUF1127 family)